MSCCAKSILHILLLLLTVEASYISRRSSRHRIESPPFSLFSSSSDSSTDSITAILEDEEAEEEVDTSQSFSNSDDAAIVHIYHEQELTVADVDSFQRLADDLNEVEDKLVDSKQKYKDSKEIYTTLYGQNPPRSLPVAAGDFGSPQYLAEGNPLSQIVNGEYDVFDTIRLTQVACLLELKELIAELRVSREDIVERLKNLVEERYSVFCDYYERQEVRLLEKLETFNRRRRPDRFLSLKRHYKKVARNVILLHDIIAF